MGTTEKRDSRRLQLSCYTAFERWWQDQGRLLDPDYSDVSWFDKRKELCRHAWGAAQAGHWNDPEDPPEKPGEVWVRWRDREYGKEEHASLGYYDPADGFVFIQAATEPERACHFGFDYIGTVTGWQHVSCPPV